MSRPYRADQVGSLLRRPEPRAPAEYADDRLSSDDLCRELELVAKTARRVRR